MSGEFLALCSFVIYLFTLAPDVYGFDSAELATGVYSMGIVHPPGYPLYMLVGKLFTFLPIRSEIYRLNLMSAFFAALTVLLLYKVIFRLIGRAWTAWVASAFLGFSIYFWQMSVVAEVYTLHTFFLVLEILILLNWRESGNNKLLVLFAFAFGLSLTNHTTGLLFAPGFAWMIISSPKWKWKPEWYWLASGLSFFAALLLYLYLPIRANSSPALDYIKDYYAVDVSTISGLYWMISGQAYHFFAFAYHGAEIWQQLLDGIHLIWRNFMGIGLILGLAGAAVSLKKDWKAGLALLLVFLGNFVFYINYRVSDKDTMFLPSFIIISIFIGYGLDFLYDLISKRAVDIHLEKVTAQGFPIFWTCLAVLGLVLNWRWTDMSQAYGPKTYSDTILSTATQNATILSSWSPAVVLEYCQIVEGKRPDLKIINQSRREVASYYEYWAKGTPAAEIMNDVSRDELAEVDQMYDQGPVYSIEYDADLARSYEYLPAGVYFQLEKKNTQ